MAKVTTIRCSASNGTDRLSIETDVSVTTKGIFSTTLKPSDVSRINQYGLRLKPNRLGNEGYFESDTLAGLEHDIKAFLDECISRERIEQKEVIKYRIRTNCHYVQSDREDGFAIYPNGTWLPKRLQDPSGNSCDRWVEGTEGRCQQNSPFRLSLYVGVFTRTVYRYASGRTVTEYEPCFSGHGRTSVDYLKGTVHMGLSDNAFGSMSMSEFRREIIQLPEVDATEENARVFVDILQFICRANGLLKQLADPGNIEAYIEQHAKLSLTHGQ